MSLSYTFFADSIHELLMPRNCVHRYSWMGAASEGGYMGSDFEAFFSAVVSGAAGVYVGVLLQG